MTTGDRVNERQNIGVRAQLLYKPSDTLNFTLGGDYNRQDPDCCAQIYVRTGATQRPLNRQYAALAAAFGYAPPSTDPFDRLTDLDTALRAKQALGGVYLRGEWDAGFATVTSVTAWRFWNWDPSNDRDFTGLPITTVSANPSKQRQWTQELRARVERRQPLRLYARRFLLPPTARHDGRAGTGARREPLAAQPQ